MRFVIVASIALVSAKARSDDYIAPHPDAAWWLSGEIDVSGAGQPGFRSGVEGANSFRSDDHLAGTILGSVFAGYAFTSTTALVVSGESIVGRVFDNARGLGAPLDDIVVRNPAAGAVPYLGSSFIDQVIPLSSERVPMARASDNLLANRPRRSLELRAGKLWAPSWFDGEAPRFSSGAIRNDAAWEYPADERGYTVGAIVEYFDRFVQVRIAEMLMPKTPRSADYEFGFANARAEIAEVAARVCVLGYPGSIRIGGFINRAHMGKYGEAIASFEIGQNDFPDVTKYRVVGAERTGLFGGIDHQLPAGVSAFASFAWSDSTTESFGVTETDHSARVGTRMRGGVWHRMRDEIGVGLAVGGLTHLHRTYLALGGMSSVLGDGGLQYAREETAEVYYSTRIVRGVTASAHVEMIVHPGFDAERGPIWVGLIHVIARQASPRSRSSWRQ